LAYLLQYPTRCNHPFNIYNFNFGRILYASSNYDALTNEITLSRPHSLLNNQTLINMHSNLLGAVLALLLSILSSNFAALENSKLNTTHTSEAFQEIIDLQQSGENIMVVDINGNQYENPNLETLQSLSPNLFTENRIRLTLNNNSEDDRCSTEIVLMDEDNGIVGNYSLNICSSFGWIFFTPHECFHIDLYHDAGLEAPTGNQVKGSVDWTFTFNDKTRLSGTYYDGGVANMLRVASPCYQQDVFQYAVKERQLQKSAFPAKKE